MSDGSTAGHEDREPESTPAADAGRETGGAPDTEDAPDTGTGRDPVDAPDTGTGRDPVGDRDSGTGRKTDTGRDAEGLRETGDGPARLRGLVTPHGQEPKHTHAGNGTVNHGRDDRGPEGLDSDELELRTLLRQAVREVEPGDGTLDYLRRAVPARRARKRQALVGMAAAALFVGTAVPALVHVTTASGSDANPSAVGHASQAQGGTGQGKDPGGGESTAGGSSDEVGGGTEDKEKDEDKDGSSTGSGTGATEGADPSADASDPAPACTAAQLGPAVANSAAPDSTGAVYGSFRVANVSTADCTVEGAGVVGVTPQGAASAAKVGSARHVAGDAAAGLPDPSQEAGQLVLKPGAAYEVQFAWVPSETCPTPGGTPGGGTGGPSPDPTPSGDPTTTTGASEGTDGGTATQTVRADGGTEGSVAVSYTASTGSSSATTTIGNACAGTVYWTGLLTPAG